MANNIELRKQYVTLLDEVLKEAAVTSDLDGNADLVKQGANANELVLPKMDMDGLAPYDKVNGYAMGDVSLTYETVTCKFDRGRGFTIDAVDDEESAGILYGNLAGEFIRTQVAPELDAYRFGAYASAEGVGHAEAELTTGANVVKALRAATSEMDDAEVPTNDRILYITSTLNGLVEDMDTTASRKVMERFAKVVIVPQTRFYTAITQGANGYSKAEGAKNLNFLIVQKKATIQFQKHVAPKVISPEMNQKADAWFYGYRNVGIADVYDNKVKCIYAHSDVK